MKEAARDLLELTLIPEIGVAQVHRLLAAVDSPGQLRSLPEKTLRKLSIPSRVWRSLWALGRHHRVDAIAEQVVDLGLEVVTLVDSNYPPLLRETFHSPPVLYLRGKKELLCEPCVALVGSRRCSSYGREVTFSFARELARLGLTVVSGLARGIDRAAHLGALEGEGNTVAVLGTGIDCVYPREHRSLWESIGKKGCLVSEFPPGTPPLPHNFPRRNRIISGLSLGTLVVEASDSSGSLVTARHSLEQNRELWAVPGSVNRPGCRGSNRLLQQGAKAILEVQDLLDELPPQVLKQLRSKIGSRSAEEVLEPLHREVLVAIPTDQRIHLDRLRSRLDLPVARLQTVLLELEIRGMVVASAGNFYHRRL